MDAQGTLIGAVLCFVGAHVRRPWLIQPRSKPFSVPAAEGATKLVETGVFSLVRHPIYTGLTLVALGWSAIWMSLAVFATTVALFIFFDMKSRRLERWLQEKFGGYGRYKMRVRKLVPFIY